ncbi:flagellar motor switch protein FliN [Altererythrobacter sp. H2]|uniref:flagellar motor switch protein FliN n=1 Tax=Altererythrobacter sp. H2 TaxID=3108391 RepID=UPI000BDA4D31|nr:flagellar motor switch protein FliN [Altererythrobacter sp. H2]OZA94180.1 MAG: flagellar motor switch protein FliN [Erythrobacter sp. 34-65-8]WRK96960.1 flagellar motor switch protein FliN [Altererythrobacter sp. H2]
MTNHPADLGLIGEVTVSLSVELGRTELALREVMALGQDSVVALDRLTDEPLDVLVNGRLIAKAEIVAENNRFALRIVELIGGRRATDAPVSEAA